MQPVLNIATKQVPTLDHSLPSLTFTNVVRNSVYLDDYMHSFSQLCKLDQFT